MYLLSQGVKIKTLIIRQNKRSPMFSRSLVWCCVDYKSLGIFSPVYRNNIWGKCSYKHGNVFQYCVYVVSRKGFSSHSDHKRLETWACRLCPLGQSDLNIAKTVSLTRIWTGVPLSSLQWVAFINSARKQTAILIQFLSQ